MENDECALVITGTNRATDVALIRLDSFNGQDPGICEGGSDNSLGDLLNDPIKPDDLKPNRPHF